MHVLVARRRASEPARSSRRSASATALVRSVLARLAAPRLDARLAAYREELYELARAALLALGSPEASGTAPARR
jgi:hypothetical protein